MQLYSKSGSFTIQHPLQLVNLFRSKDCEYTRQNTARTNLYEVVRFIRDADPLTIKKTKDLLLGLFQSNNFAVRDRKGGLLLRTERPGTVSSGGIVGSCSFIFFDKNPPLFFNTGIKFSLLFKWSIFPAEMETFTFEN